jgi:hypothetical protein
MTNPWKIHSLISGTVSVLTGLATCFYNPKTPRGRAIKETLGDFSMATAISAVGYELLSQLTDEQRELQAQAAPVPAHKT